MLEIIIKQSLKLASRDEFDAAVELIVEASDTASTLEDIKKLRKAVADIHCMVPNGDVIADYWNQSITASVANSYKTGSVKTVVLN